MEIIHPLLLPGREWTWAYAGDLSQVVNFILSAWIATGPHRVHYYYSNWRYGDTMVPAGWDDFKVVEGGI